MKYKLLIIAVALGVIGAAVEAACTLAYGRASYHHIGRYGAQLPSFLVGASRADNHGIERDLQSPDCRGLARRRGVIAERD